MPDSSPFTEDEEADRRLCANPGFGESKARIFICVLSKRLGEGPPGWEAEAADLSSIADIDSFEKASS